MNDVLTGMLDAVAGVDPTLRVLLAGVAMMLDTSILVGLIVPGDTVVLVAATAVATPLQGVWLGVAIVAGSLAGESIGFWLGRALGPRIRDSRLGRMIGEKHWQHAETYLSRRGGWAVFISRFLPVLHSLVPLTVGMSRFGYRRFLAWTLPASALWAGAYVTVSSLAAGTYREMSGELHVAGLVFVAIIAAFLVAVVSVKKLLARMEARHLEAARGRAGGADAVPGMGD